MLESRKETSTEEWKIVEPINACVSHERAQIMVIGPSD